MMNDRELLDRFLAVSDESAFHAILQRHGRDVARICQSVLAERHAAEDAFQATFLLLLQRAEAIRDPDALGRWLHGVAFRIAVRLKRRQQALRGRECGGVDWIEDPSETSDVDEEAVVMLHQELERLPARLREPIRLCHFEELTYEEAARRLNRPLGTFKHQLTQGRSLLRDRLKRRGVALSTILLLLGTHRGEAADWTLWIPETIDRARRFQTGLEPAIDVSVIEEIPPPPTEPVSTLWIPAVASLLVMLVLTVGGIVLWLSLAFTAGNSRLMASEPPDLDALPATAPPPVLQPPTNRKQAFEVHSLLCH